MPTNQSSPWNVGHPGHCSSAEKIAATKTSKVPYSQASIQLARSKEQAQPLAGDAASSASPSRPMAVKPPVRSVWERGEKKTAEGCSTAVPHVSSNMPPLNGTQLLKPVLAAGLNEAKMDARASAPSPVQPKESLVGSLASRSHTCFFTLNSLNFPLFSAV